MKVTKHNFKVGDAVLYLPHEVHATEVDSSGNCAWVLGWRRGFKRRQEKGVAPEEDIEELTSPKRIRQVLNAIRKAADPREERKKLKLIRPANPWPATVRTVNEDGTVNLDIQTCRGVTLHYDGIEVDPSRTKHHTCHGA